VKVCFVSFPFFFSWVALYILTICVHLFHLLLIYSGWSRCSG
jgi:hypothetical protein